MAIKECGRGHMYDTSLYASCPYCGGGQAVIDFGQPAGGVPVGAPGETQAPMGYAPAPGFGAAPMQGMGPIPGAGQAVADVGHTMPPAGWGGSEPKKATDDQETKSIVGMHLGVEPVVGWLVCIDGKNKGTDYRLYSKINTIGRGEKMDVRIKNDPTVTQDVHARLAYDPKHNNYNLIPGNNSNNIYLNDEPVYSPTRLNAYDVLEIGQTELIFVPLCTGRFTWDKGLQNGEETSNGAC